MSSIIKLLIVVDGIFSLTTTYPIDPAQQPFAPATDTGPDGWFTLSHLIYTLRNCPSPTIVVDTASRGFSSPPGQITNTAPDPYATIKGPDPRNPTPFHFDDPGFNLLEYDEIWLFGYEGYNGGAARGPKSGTSEPGRLSDSELSKIAAFMTNGGGVFAVGDHDGLGAGMCGFIPRVRYMRKWFENGDSSSGLPPNWVPNWRGFGPDRVDTLQQGKTDAGLDKEGNPIFFFDDQSDDIPQYLEVLAPTHPAIQGATGVLHAYPDHMHEGEVMVPTATQLAQPSASNGLGFAGPAFVEFPTMNGHRELPLILATSIVGTQGPNGIEIGHVTMVPSGTTAEDLPCENQNFSSDATPCNPKFNNTLAAYDGHKVNVGRIVTDSSWHHFLDLNLIGDPCSNVPTKRMGFNASASGRAYLKEIDAFYVNLAIWLASPKFQRPVPVKSGGSTEILGMVIDPNETPIPGATISFGPLDPTNPVQRTSDSKGMYLFDAFAIDAAFAPDSSTPGYRFPSGPFTITAAKDGYITSSQTTTVVEGQAVIRGFVLQPILPFKLTGQVFTQAGTPIPKAAVTLFFGLPSQQMVAAAPAAYTNSSGGTYTISNVNPGQWTGEYTVTASAPGFLTGTNVILNVLNGQPMTSNFTLMTPHSFDIIVNVTGDFGPQTDPTVEPVTRATVTAYASSQSYPAHNNGGGSYTISNVNPGTYIGDYSVLVEATGFVQQKVDVPQPDGTSATISVELHPTPPKIPPWPPKPGTAM